MDASSVTSSARAFSDRLQVGDRLGTASGGVYGVPAAGEVLGGRAAGQQPVIRTALEVWL